MGPSAVRVRSLDPCHSPRAPLPLRSRPLAEDRGCFPPSLRFGQNRRGGRKVREKDGESVGPGWAERMRSWCSTTGAFGRVGTSDDEFVLFQNVGVRTEGEWERLIGFGAGRGLSSAFRSFPLLACLSCCSRQRRLDARAETWRRRLPHLGVLKGRCIDGFGASEKGMRFVLFYQYVSKSLRSTSRLGG